MAGEWQGAAWLRLRQGPLGMLRAEPCAPAEAEWISRRQHEAELEAERRRAARELERVRAEASREVQGAQARVRELEDAVERLRDRLGRALAERRSWKLRALGQAVDEVRPARLENHRGDWWLVEERLLDAAPDAAPKAVLDEALRLAAQAKREPWRVRRTRNGWVAELGQVVLRLKQTLRPGEVVVRR